jgi:superfamily II DNA or RNA helicase
MNLYDFQDIYGGDQDFALNDSNNMKNEENTTYSLENKQDKFPIRDMNSTSTPMEIKHLLESEDYDKTQILMYHQFIAKQYFVKNPHLRGILVCHATGQGKTLIAVTISNYYREIFPDRQILVLLPKSLEANFRQNIKKYLSNSYSEPQIEDVYKKYKFVSMNASNMYIKMRDIDKAKEEIEYEKRLGEFMKDVIKGSSLEGSLLIIDEAHNFFNSITNNSKNAIQLYDLIMKTKDIKLIFLSGTPIVNEPFELVPCFNMCSGNTQSTDIEGALQKGRNKKNNSYAYNTLFSEDKREFNDFFVDYAAKKIKNKDKFQNRIYGLVSYYGNIYISPDTKGLPKKLPTIVERIHMSEIQFANYMVAREQEKEEAKIKFKGKAARFGASKNSGSTYRVKSRQASNYCIPEYALGPARGAKARKKYIERIKYEDLRNVDKYSPKYARVLQNLRKHIKQPGLVYSQFVSGEGLFALARIMEAYGYELYKTDKIESLEDIYGESVDSFGKNKGHSKRERHYAIISGNVDPQERTKIINIFNSIENIHGDVINVLLISGAAVEGVDFKRPRHGHVIEPFWNDARIEQFIGRFVRIGSHDGLPESEKNVQIYIYLSDYPNKMKKEDIVEPTTDVDLYDRALSHKELNNSFMQSLAEASFDCALHWSSLDKDRQKLVHCKLCVPDGKQLYNPILVLDMQQGNPCREPQQKNIRVNTIKHEDQEYYYSIDGKKNINLYYYDDTIGKHMPMKQNSPIYHILLEKILKGGSE